MLHITNGDSAAARLTQAGISGRLLPWRDVLHEGPLPADLSLDDLRPIRARFLAAQGWGDEQAILADLRERDAALAAFRDYPEVVLWFEHDLYDQLQLIQALDWFAGRDLGPTRLSIVLTDRYLGAASPEELRPLFAERRAVTSSQLMLAQRAWQTVRSPDPTAIGALLDQESAALPFLAAALLRHLQQFPALHSGLSRSEAQALAALSSGDRSLRELYRAAHHAQEQAIFLGDTIFVWYVEQLGRGPDPLITLADGAASDGDAYQRSLARTASLTATGRAVLAGQRDQIALNGIDRWLGGVHLTGRSAPWRWNESVRRLEQIS
jgi:hypothetical protein